MWFYVDKGKTIFQRCRKKQHKKPSEEDQK
jgi:hypothetical protein